MSTSSESNQASRRGFLMGAAGAATAAAISPVAHAQGSQMLKIGTIGCGNRGAMDVRDMLTGNDDVQLVAMADVFEDYIDRAQQKLQDPKYFGGKWDKAKDKFKVQADTTFLGVDAYKRLLEMDDVDIVMLLTPPGFRAMHMRAAVEAGKHVFFEKPAAVDATSIRSIIESGEIAKQKGLSIIGGTQQRRMPHYVEVMNRVMDGAIGPITAGYASWHWANTDWHYEPRQPEWSDTEWQIRCWPYFTWLSGDHIVEQHVHNLDVMNWALGNPVNCLGRGGRQVRTDGGYGNIYDHFGVEYEYENGVRVCSMSSQMKGVTGRVVEGLVGPKGQAWFSRNGCYITGENEYKFQGETHDGGEKQFQDLTDSIRNGEPINEAERIAHSTLTAIMGRMSSYSGKSVSWSYALNASKENLFPKNLKIPGKLPVAPVAMPGVTKVV
jgi:predicted dehydrogenase